MSSGMLHNVDEQTQSNPDITPKTAVKRQHYITF
jgi:hypothetical protein